MTDHSRTRLILALMGAAAGGSLHALIEVLEQNLLPDRVALALAAFAAPFFTALLALTGPLALGRALVSALSVAVPVSLLTAWSSLRFATVEGHLQSAFPFLAAMVLTLVPLPFLIARGQGRWDAYPVLFQTAWTLVVRVASALVFAGFVWLVLFLSDALLSIVGIGLIGALTDLDPVPFLLTGGVIGLGLAVVQELSDFVSPYLMLRMLRLVLPVVLVVSVVFLLAVPLRGLDGLFAGLSAALTLMAMVAAGVTLVSAVVDRDDAAAASALMMTGAARAMALALPVMAGLAAWAVWLRVGQYGWTPERLFAALVAAVGLAYGLAYAAAVLRGNGWMARIRHINTLISLLILFLAALWLTPVLDAERIAAQSQLARFAAGKTAVADLDITAIDRWGHAGAAVRAALEEQAKAPGQEALAARLANAGPAAEEGDPAAALQALVDVLPLQPAGATATRDILLSGLPVSDLRAWEGACGRRLAGGGPACVMVVADLLPRLPGEEAVVLADMGGWIDSVGLVLGAQGVERRSLWHLQGFPEDADLRALIADWQRNPPPLMPAQLNQLGAEDGLMLVP